MWEEWLMLGDSGPKPNPFNVLTAIRCAPEFEGVFKLNEFANEIEVHAPFPWYHVKEKAAFRPRATVDNDFTCLQVWLNQRDINAYKTTAVDVALVEAKRHGYHPVRDYLDSLKWDGKQRLDTWLCDYLGAADTPYTRDVARK
jgi:predicted P-loop ATPase